MLFLVHPILVTQPAEATELECSIGHRPGPIQDNSFVSHPVILEKNGGRFSPYAIGFDGEIGGRFLDDYNGKSHLGLDYNLSKSFTDQGQTDKGETFRSISHGWVKCIRDVTTSDSWGRIIVIESRMTSGLRFWVTYLHMESISEDIGLGAHVSQDQALGTIGDSNGYYSGQYHLHVDIRLDGRYAESMSGDWPQFNPENSDGRDGYNGFNPYAEKYSLSEYQLGDYDHRIGSYIDPYIFIESGGVLLRNSPPFKIGWNNVRRQFEYASDNELGGLFLFSRTPNDAGVMRNAIHSLAAASGENVGWISNKFYGNEYFDIGEPTLRSLNDLQARLPSRDLWIYVSDEEHVPKMYPVHMARGWKKFQPADHVVVTTSVSLRTAEATDFGWEIGNARAGTVDRFTEGTVLGGPIEATFDGHRYWFYRVEFPVASINNPLVGIVTSEMWVVADYIEFVPRNPTPPAAEVVTHTGQSLVLAEVSFVGTVVVGASYNVQYNGEIGDFALTDISWRCDNGVATAEVHWSNAQNATDYTLYGNSSVIANNIATNQYSHRDDSIIPGREYQFFLRAYSAGESKLSSNTLYPRVPQDICASEPTPEPIRNPTIATSGVTFDDGVFARMHALFNDDGENVLTGFEFGRSAAYTDTTPLFAHAASSSDTQFNWSVGLLACDETYHFRAVMESEDQTVIYGDDQSFSTPPCAYQTPVNLAATVDDAGPQLVWVEGQLPDGVHIEIARMIVNDPREGLTIGSWESISTNPKGVFSWIDTFLDPQPGSVYQYRIRSVNSNAPIAVQNSEWSTVTTIEYPEQPTYTLPTPTITATRTRIDIIWPRADDRFLRYDVELNKNSTAWAVFGSAYASRGRHSIYLTSAEDGDEVCTRLSSGSDLSAPSCIKLELVDRIRSR